MASAPLLMLDEGPLILDGGLATELEAQGAKLQVSVFMDATCVMQKVSLISNIASYLF